MKIELNKMQQQKLVNFYGLFFLKKREQNENQSIRVIFHFNKKSNDWKLIWKYLKSSFYYLLHQSQNSKKKFITSTSFRKFFIIGRYLHFVNSKNVPCKKVWLFPISKDTTNKRKKLKTKRISKHMHICFNPLTSNDLLN